MTGEPRFKIGDRVVRPITARGSMTDVVGYRRGAVASVRIERMHTVLRSTFWYDIIWDNQTKPDCGFSESSLVAEEDFLQRGR